MLLVAWALMVPCAVARGGLFLNVESVQLAPGESGAVEVYFTELPQTPAPDEQLVGYFVTLALPGGPAGPRFGVPTLPVDHPFVLPGARLSGALEGETRVSGVVGFPSTPVLPQDIEDGEGVLRVPVSVPLDTPPGAYPITVVRVGGYGTEFHDRDSRTIAFLPMDGYVYVPEPSSTGYLALVLAVISLGRHPGRRLARGSWETARTSS
jgi:hypothetical protein